jgi:hypothetical protein
MHSPLPRPTHFPPRALKAAIAVLLAVLAARAAAAPTATEIDPWRPSGSDFLIAGPLRLNLGFVDQSGTPRVAVVSSLQPAQLDGLPGGLVQAKNSDLLQAGHFDALWSAMKAGVCNDVQQRILQLVNHSPNTAYDMQPCVMNPKGYLTANFQESWEDDSMQNVTGRRINFRYITPLNGVTFWVTSPHTCHHGDNCPTEPQDPVYTVVFTTAIMITCTSSQPNATSFTLPVACTSTTSVDIEDVIGGDVTGQLVAATVQWTQQMVGEAASIVASGGASVPEAAAAFAAEAVNVAVKGLGAAIAAVTDQHLRDQVSAWIIGFVGSPTLGANAQNINADFSALFQNLYMAYLGGLKPFVVAISPQLDFDFGLVYPLPAKPQLQNTTAAANKGSLFSPTIAVSQPEVVAGQAIPVTASFFRGAYVNTLNIAWNKTVLGAAKSALTWGPPKVTITTPALTFDATNLKPATSYGFVVHECDGLTCAPLSEVLTTATEAAGSNDVTFWLDNNTTQKLGSNVVSTSGNQFETNITIPAATTTGTHQLHAGVPGSPPASATIQVCQPGGCGPSVALVNTSNNTLYPPGSVVEAGNPVVLRGSKFEPGQSVWIWVDSVQGTKAGTAPVGPLGNFQASFTMPQIAAGKHNLLAIELKPGVKMPPTQKGNKPVFPPSDFVSASVAVYVQAMAQ